MGRREVINRHLATFAARVHLGQGLAVGPEGVCGITLGSDEAAVQVGVEVREEDALILFHADLGTLDPRAGLDQHRRLLVINVYGVETSGGVLGLDREAGKIVLTYAWLFEEMEYTHFEAMLERLFVGTNHLRGLLAREGGASRTAAASGVGGEPPPAPALDLPPASSQAGVIWG